MAIRIEHVDDIAIVVADGRFISEEQVNELDTILTRLLSDGGPQKILLDMSRMEFLRSISIGVIATAHGAALQHQVKFWLCGMNARNRSAFDLMHFGAQLKVFETRPEALAALRET